ncbi:MAG TPA: PepSY-associated TM helix domain-containing protein [Arenimonas sp.]|uniref:PepSY-associated TM helix domain-containing protein n=1 Tax=Arenimonas sp. TaxID=1872635 RepID=UPI002C6E1C4A|nr:PepSY-associated TM helix domain-containing protein [Arenimonas sp.]HMB55906.1 PepSY-associated TM helix domain-containing protein [Arenimonas sp.]
MNAIPSPAVSRTRWYPLIRQLHLWIGAWGALAAILFGFSGLFLNHRAIWQVPQGERTPLGMQHIAVPTEARATPEGLAAWLKNSQGLSANRVRVQDAETKPDGSIDPAVWSIAGGTAHESWNAEFVPGDASLALKRTRSDPLATVLALHKSQSGNIGWILLADSFGLAMGLLGISGIVMWARGRNAKEMAVSLLGLCALVVATLFGLGLA